VAVQDAAVATDDGDDANDGEASTSNVVVSAINNVVSGGVATVSDVATTAVDVIFGTTTASAAEVQAKSTNTTAEENDDQKDATKSDSNLMARIGSSFGWLFGILGVIVLFALLWLLWLLAFGKRNKVEIHFVTADGAEVASKTKKVIKRLGGGHTSVPEGYQALVDGELTRRIAVSGDDKTLTITVQPG
jgi:hypothetical protein